MRDAGYGQAFCGESLQHPTSSTKGGSRLDGIRDVTSILEISIFGVVNVNFFFPLRCVVFRHQWPVMIFLVAGGDGEAR